MRRLVLITSFVLCGCGDEAMRITPSPTCREGEIELPDKTCIRPGLRPGDCAEGWSHDGDAACEPLLPAACGPGEIAIPGDETCHEIVSCGEAPWGDIPVEANTQYVDAAFTGTSTGTADQPWLDLQDAVDAAAAGAIVAVAEGTYGPLAVVGKAVRLWGRCPQLVSIAAMPIVQSVVELSGADGYELRGVQISGGQFGVAFSGGSLTLDSLWIHDTAAWGATQQTSAGPTAVHANNLLVERTTYGGMQVFGGELTLENSVIRDSIADAAGNSSAGLVAFPPQNGTSIATVRRTLFDRNTGLGVGAMGSTISVESIVIRDTQPGTSLGMGAAAIEWAGIPGSLTITGSLIQNNLELGVLAQGSTATVERSVIRDTRSESPLGYGGAIAAEDGADGAPGQLTLLQSLMDRNIGVSVRARGTALTIDGTVIRDTVPSDTSGFAGRGVHLQVAPTGIPASLLMRRSLVDTATSSGVLVISAPGTIESSLIRGTLADVNGIADAITVVAYQGMPSAVDLVNVHAADNTRAAISLFGGSIGYSGFRGTCNAIDVNGEPLDTVNFSVEDRGDNACGCPDASADCEVLTLGLEFLVE